MLQHVSQLLHRRRRNIVIGDGGEGGAVRVSGYLAVIRVGFEGFGQSMEIKIVFGLVTEEKSLLGWNPYPNSCSG